MHDAEWSRRQLLGAGALAGVAALLPRLAAAAAQRPGAIDVHHHLMPPFYVEATMARQLRIAGPLSPTTAAWTPARSVEEMDRNHIAASLVSVSTPGPWTGDSAASRSLARRCNEYAAQMTAAHPGRFGWMATLPLPDRDGSLAEMAYSLDTLKADGIGLMTSYDDKWLGDPAFDAAFDELNRRGAVVFVHPTTSDCCTNLIPVVRSSYTEFPFDTTRAIVNLLYSGTFTRCPRIRFIFSHGGGALPMVNSRIAAPAAMPEMAAKLPNGAHAELKRQFYDTASVTNKAAFAGLSNYVPTSQILFGTDYPFGQNVGGAMAELAALGMPAADLQRIHRDNALTLFARLRG